MWEVEIAVELGVELMDSLEECRIVVVEVIFVHNRFFGAAGVHDKG